MVVTATLATLAGPAASTPVMGPLLGAPLTAGGLAALPWLLVVVLACAALVILQGNAHVLQYLFFGRYPLLVGLLLVLGPALAVQLSPEMFGNLLVLDAMGLGIVCGLAWFLASTAVYTGNLTFGLAFSRTGLPFFRASPATPEPAQVARQRRISDWVSRRHVALSTLLAAPFALQVCRSSAASGVMAVLAAGLGIGAAMGVHAVGTLRLGGRDAVALVRAAARALLRPLSALVQRWSRSDSTASSWPRRSLATMLRSAMAGYQDLDEPGGSHGRAAVFFLASLLVYFAGYFLLHASFGEQTVGHLGNVVPPLAYLLLLALIFAWLLPALAFFFDKYRVPVIVPAGLVWLLLAVVSRSEHFFDHQPVTGAEASSGQRCALTPTLATQRWAERNATAAPAADGAPRPTLVVVAASGGGITASLWSARVLAGLVNDPRLGEAMGRSIGLVSSASGGGVGAMHFVNAYHREGAPASAQLAAVVEAAGASSLNETGFALAYDDFLRLLVPSALAGGLRDRGQALERSWSRRLGSREPRSSSPTLASWRLGVAEGWRPTQIFNATIAETGERLVLSPVAFPMAACARGSSATPWRARSLDELYQASDLSVVTAARLSATFPWITPQSRADTQSPHIPGYHLADGGYYDNFGVVSAIEWLSQVHADTNLATLVDKVLVLQIRASQDVLDRPPQEAGWVHATVGPLLTLLNVRVTSQRNHNDAALAALRSLLFANGVPLESVDFELDIQAPTSWHLSDLERRRITEQWERNPTIRKQRDHLACLWRAPGAAWPASCGVKPPPGPGDPTSAARLLEQTRPPPDMARPVPVPTSAPKAP